MSDIPNQNDDAPTPDKLADDLRESMAAHLRQKAQEIINKYGVIDYHALQQFIEDRKFVRYPVSIVFDSSRIEAGLFAITETINPASNASPNEDDQYTKPAEQHYEIVMHEYFKGQEEKLLPLVLYQLPIVNYGDVVSYEDSEVFGSEIMGLTQDAYYQLVCDLVDSIPVS